MASDNVNLNLTEEIRNNTRAQEDLVDPTLRLNRRISDLAAVQADNINEVRFFRNTIMQQNNVANRLKDSIVRADQINVKGLGQNITLQKIIDQNSKAINESS